VVQRSSVTTSKKVGSQAFPDNIDLKWFRYTFISTYITFVSQTADPWDVPVRQAIEVMQKIWDATSDDKYEIMTSTLVYQRVGHYESTVSF
jgi:hypothetical protein